MTDKYTKLTKTILTQNTNATAAARIDLEHWMASFNVRSKLLTGNGAQFVSKLQDAQGKHITITEYDPQTNGQAKLFNY